jgi:hypothetical protein
MSDNPSEVWHLCHPKVGIQDIVDCSRLLVTLVIGESQELLNGGGGGHGNTLILMLMLTARWDGESGGSGVLSASDFLRAAWVVF